jgi:ABC-type uncharacterized transport system ATPase subunit
MSDPSLSARVASHEAIRLTGITKRFGSVIANDHVNLSVRKGEIHGIIGENGAGKSTLMSILYGFYHADEGEIQVDGVPVKIQSSDHAIRLGIGMVHQHFMLVSTFTVLENIMLGAEGSWSIKQGAAQARIALKALSKQYGLQVDPDALISDLSVGEQQRVEILKALYRKADILILDEPTGVLTPQEVDQLFSILRTLKAEGLAVLLITHKLQEVLSITDRVTVMRQGKQVAVTETATTSREALAELMVGRKVLLSVDKTPCHHGAQTGDDLINKRRRASVRADFDFGVGVFREFFGVALLLAIVKRLLFLALCLMFGPKIIGLLPHGRGPRKFTQ